MNDWPSRTATHSTLDKDGVWQPKEQARAENARGDAATISPADIIERLQELRGDLHVNELRHSGTRDGTIYSRMGATVALALIEIEHQRTLNAAITSCVLDDTEGDLDFVKYLVRDLIAKAKGA